MVQSPKGENMRVAIIGSVLVAIIAFGCHKQPTPEQLCGSVYDKFIDCVSVLITEEQGSKSVQEGLRQQRPVFMGQCLEAIQDSPEVSVQLLQGVLKQSCQKFFDVP
jgi:hypothetical protein